MIILEVLRVKCPIVLFVLLADTRTRFRAAEVLEVPISLLGFLTPPSTSQPKTLRP
jgi:hypothetical protein